MLRLIFIYIMVVSLVIGVGVLQATTGQPIIETQSAQNQNVIIGIEIQTKRGLLKAAYAVEVGNSKYKLFGGFCYYEDGHLKLKGDSVIVDTRTKVFTNARSLSIY